ncbi:hypothetical protein [Prevotella falsenii]|uniref:hypothetical protein n=1 Tax=Prevotella falsenii TaxID=515414 RepID=UPI000468EFFD|nr:hypothetical protein [Prevotella falsenii]
MKKTINILLLLLLSVLIVWTTTGVVLMQCAHTGNVAIGKKPIADRGCGKGADKGCMKVQVLKLTEASQASTTQFDLQPLQLSLLEPLVTLLIALPTLLFIVSPIRLMPYCRHSPPRRYLQRLTVLII